MLALALAGSIPYGWAALASCALGGGIQLVNVRLLERHVSVLLSPSVSPGGLRIVLAFRFLAVVGAVGLALFALPLDRPWFVVGLSTLIPAALWHGLAEARRLRAEGR